MNLRPTKRAAYGTKFLLAVLLLIASAGAAAAQESATSIEVYWKSSQTIPLAGVTKVAALDEEICAAEIAPDHVQLTGLKRGQTVLFAWVGEQRVAWRVRVVERPEMRTPPTLSRAQAEALGRGTVDSSVTTTTLPSGSSAFLLQQQFDFVQHAAGRSLTVRAQTQSSTGLDSRRFNLASGLVQYSGEGWGLAAGDFLFSPGGAQASVTPMPSFNHMALRGGSFYLDRGRNRVEFFAGSTIPLFYLSLSGTSSIAGATFTRNQTDRLYLYSTVGGVSLITAGSAGATTRQQSGFATTGFAFRWSPRLSLQGMAGLSTRGAVMQGGIAYTGARLNLYGSASDSSRDFPLTRMQLLFAGGKSLTAGGGFVFSRTAAVSGYVQHSVTESNGATLNRSTGNYASSTLALSLGRGQQVAMNYAHSTSDQQLASQSTTGSRFNVVLNSTTRRQIANTAEFSLNRLQDRTELNSESSYSVRDAVTVPFGAGAVSFGFQHERTDPSLVGRLRSQLQLLTPEQQQLFLLDPAAFTRTLTLPPETRMLLQNIQPSNTEGFVSGQFRVGRLSITPTLRFSNDIGLAAGQSNTTANLGYNLVYGFGRGFQIYSALSSVVGLDVKTNSLQRARTMTFGFRKTFLGSPPLLNVSRLRPTIHGRICVDMNVDGRCDVSEPGLAGIQVHVDETRVTLTDRDGRYTISHLSRAEHHLWLDVSQFKQRIRVTTPVEVTVDLQEDALPDVSFGIVNFSRVLGTVYNNYAFDRTRQPDAPGIRGVRLRLKGMGQDRTVRTDSSGEFEFLDVAPGTYEIALDRDSIPPDFIIDEPTAELQVTPTSTVVHDVGIRALRSVAGHVYLKRAVLRNQAAPPSEPRPRNRGAEAEPAATNRARVAASATEEIELVPLRGVKLSIAGRETETNDAGEFLIRDLPAGIQLMAVIARSSVPAGLHLPTGNLPLPMDPVRVQDVKVVIANPELLVPLGAVPVSAPTQISRNK